MPEITKLSNLSLELQKQTTPRLNDTKMTHVLFASLKYWHEKNLYILVHILEQFPSFRVNLEPNLTFQKVQSFEAYFN